MIIERGLDSFIQLGAGAVSRSFQDRLRDTVHAADFAGADAGAKIVAAIASLPSTGGIVDATQLRGAQTCSVNPFSAITKPVTLLLGDVTLSISVPWVITAHWQNIVGVARERSKIVYTGAAADHALYYDGSAIATGMRLLLRDLTVHGNVNTANAITLRLCARFTVDNVQAAEATDCGFNILGCVLGYFNNPMVSTNAGPFTVVPAFGMRLDWDVSPNLSAANTILHPLMESGGGTMTGIKEDHSWMNRYFGGTSEGNGVGMEFTANAVDTSVTGMDFEVNTVKDILCAGEGIEFHAVPARSILADGVHVTGPGNRILNCKFYNLTIDNHLNTIIGSHIVNDLIDNSAETVIDNTFVGATLTTNKNQNFSHLNIQGIRPSMFSLLNIQAHATDQGVVPLVRIRNAAGVDRWVVSAAGESYAVLNSYFEGPLIGAPSLYLQPGAGASGSLRDDASANVMYWNAAGMNMQRRFKWSDGGSITAANDITLGMSGNVFLVNGATPIHAIDTANWQAGSVVILFFSGGGQTVKHNTAGGAGTAPIYLNGSVDFAPGGNALLELLYYGQWHEVSRKIP